MLESTRNPVMPSYSDLRAYFPKGEIRQAQDYVLKEIASALDQGFKMIVLEAPTGFGKSAVAVTLAKALGESYLLTATKDLQEQYSGEYPFIWKIIGRSNFDCFELKDLANENKSGLKVKVGEKLTCDAGPCTGGDYKCKYKSNRLQYTRVGNTVEYNPVYTVSDDEDDEVELVIENPCKYYHQKHRGLTINHTIMNYSYFFTLCTYSPKDIDPRRLIVFDEAHSMEEKMKEFATVSFTRKGIENIIPEFQFPIVDESTKYDIPYWKQYLKGLFVSLRKVELFITERDPEAKITLADDIKKDELIKTILDDKLHVSFTEEYVEDLKKLMEKIESLIIHLSEHPDNWVMCHVENDNRSSKGIFLIDFVPLDVSEFFKSIYQKGEVILCMSATILDKDAFCKSVGLPLDKVKYLAVSSDFPLENRPIYPLSIAKLNSVSLQQPDVQQKLASCIDKIMTRHRDQKGIIHTKSYKQCLFIKEHLSPNNRIRISETVDREKILIEHKNRTYPSVLLSPSLHTGIDLKDELSRFQVIVKVPYPDLGDRWIKAKLAKSQQWYSWQTALTLVQAYGRSIRSKEDWAKTYVLDSQFFNFVSNNRAILPRWFTDAIKYPLPSDVLALK